LSGPSILVIVGTGDHARVMADVARAAGRAVAGFIRPGERSAAGDLDAIDGVPLLGALDGGEPRPNIEGEVEFVVAIGANRVRDQAFRRCLALGWQPVALVHPTAILLGGAHIAPGAQVCAAAVIGLAADIGANVIVNTAASVDHDGRVGDHAFIGPGARLAGRVTVEEGTHVGIGAVVREGCTIGAWSYVAAGAVVVDDVPGGIRVAGVPARLMDRQPPEDQA
jgi:sugar O-acyltransferase (sialic acid O-acetyltransferase NeuD family)